MVDRFRNGDRVRLLLRPPREGAAYTVLAWQRPGQRRVHYTGLRPTFGFVVVGVLFLLMGNYMRSGSFIGAGIALLALQAGIAAWKGWTFYRFHKPGRWRSGPSTRVAEPLSVSRSAVASSPEPQPQPQPSVPLDLHTLPQGSRAAEAGNWPSEILEFTHDAIIIWEMGGAGILYWNRAAEQLYGYSRQEARGRVTHELLKTQLTGGVDELETRVIRYGLWIGALRHTRKDGRRVEVEGRLTLMPQKNGQGLVLEVNRDVTDRNAAELARRQMEAQLAQHVATLSDE
jgi:PAS domain S-box-containing protein